jgi:hypothetical protein
LIFYKRKRFVFNNVGNHPYSFKRLPIGIEKKNECLVVAHSKEGFINAMKCPRKKLMSVV